MEIFQQVTSWFSNQKPSGKVAIGCVSGCVGLFMLCCLCSIPIAILNPSKPASIPIVATLYPTTTTIPIAATLSPTAIPIVATLTPTPTLVPEFSYADIIQSPNEKGWTSTQYSVYRETIKGKQVNGWSGTILEIKEWGGEPYLSLNMKEGEPLIDAYIYISKDDVLKVGLGQNVTFSGTIDDDWAEANDFYSLQIKNVKLLKLGEIPTPTPIPTLQPTPTLEPIPTYEPTKEISQEILTIENNADMAALFKVSDSDPFISEFAKKYSGRTIQFDGFIANMAPHGNYKTRFDLLICTGNYDKPSRNALMFKFENINIVWDLKLTGSNIPEYIGEGQNLRITAKVKEYNDVNGLFFLEPVSTEIR